MDLFTNPEIELLLCCARTSIDNVTSTRIKELLHKKLDWEALLQKAKMNGVVPLFYRNLKGTYPKLVPDNFMKQLRSFFVANAKRNLFLTAKLLKILELLKRQRILAIPFKGPVLAENVYGDLSLRYFADLDILVCKHDSLKACNLLISQGYQPEIKLKDLQFLSYLKTECGIKFISSDDRFMMDLQWEMAGKHSSFPFNLDSLKDRLESVTLAGKKVFHLSQEVLLLYLCYHGTKHCWKRLDLICDVAELIQSRPDIDWSLLSHLAKGRHWERMLSLGLFLVHSLLDAPIPFQVLERVERDRKVKKQAKEVYDKLLYEKNKFSNNWVSSRFSLFQLEVRERLIDRVRHCIYLAICPTKKEWILFPLPASISFLHYLLRPIRLVVEFVSLILRGRKKVTKTIAVLK